MGKRKQAPPAAGGLPPKDQWQRYAPIRGSGVRLHQAISISATGRLTISADLAPHLGDSPFISLWAWPPGKADKTLLFIQASDGGELGCLKGQIGENGSRRFTAKSVAHQFGIDVPGQAQAIPARWDAKEGVIVGDLAARTLRPEPRRKSEDAAPPAPTGPSSGSSKGGPRYEGRMNCPGCGKNVAWRLVEGVKKVRAHKAPDGVECLGEDFDDPD